MKKKLLFIIDQLGSGGAEKSLTSLLPLLDYSLYDVDLIIMARGGIYEKYVPSQVNIINYILYGKSRIDRIRKQLHQVNFSYQLRRCPKRHGAETHWRTMNGVVKPLERCYDVAIAYQQGLPTFFVATKVNAKTKISWVNADIFAAGYDLDYCRQFYDKMDAVVPVSLKLKDLLTERAPWISKKLYCIYDIINPDVIRQLAQEPVDDMPATEGEEISIVTVGRLSKPKNHLLAVETARMLKDKGMKFTWYFVGEGEMRPVIENKIKEAGLEQNVVLLGLKENPYPYMARAVVYVQTSSFEGFGLTIAEAKILQKPVVSTDFDIVYDQIQDGKNGLIAQMTPEDVAEKVIKILSDAGLRESIRTELSKESNTTTITEPEKFNRLIRTLNN